ncbi:MAG: divalent-cation tolerance protein CutA [Desulfobacterales bacterium]|jgi:periplasmic divalent cation tolerance protein|nr:divalent-cation tolerance protein CutA [Desulfobacterales bacterium]
MNETRYIIIFITASSGEEAVKIGKTLVEDKLAACANIVPEIRSIFNWRGKICDENEVLLIAKSKESLFQQIKERVIELHSYDVPEIIAITIHSGSEDYLSWIDEVTKN